MAVKPVKCQRQPLGLTKNVMPLVLICVIRFCRQRYLIVKKTDINIVMGLCVGHDSLFYKYSKALTTTLVTKDRVLGHNPVAALNCAHSYYMDKLENCISRYAQDKQA